MVDSPMPAVPGHESHLEQRGTIRESLVTCPEEIPDNIQSDMGPDVSAAQQSRQNDSHEDMQAFVRQQVQQEYWSKMAQEPPSDSDAAEENLREPEERHIPPDHMRQQGLENIYTDFFKKAYAELKRKEAHRREIIETVKAEMRDDPQVNLENIEMRLKNEIEELKQRVESLTTAAQKADTHEPPDPISLIDPWDYLDDQHSASPQDQHADSVVFSYLDEDGAAELSRSSSRSSSNSSSASFDDGGGGGFSDTNTENNEPSVTKKKSRVVRSRPWKGVTNLSGFFERVPFYLRGSDAGQTWYHGDDPVYIIEFQKGYRMDGAISTEPKRESTSTNAKPYLLVSHQWIDSETLDKFGFKYKECAPHGYYLDPSLTSRDIQVLNDFTFAMREIEVFRKFGTTPLDIFPCPPPEAADFENEDTAKNTSAHPSPTRAMEDGPPGSEVKATKARRPQMCASMAALIGVFALSFIYYLGLL